MFLCTNIYIASKMFSKILTWKFTCNVKFYNIYWLLLYSGPIKVQEMGKIRKLYLKDIHVVGKTKFLSHSFTKFINLKITP